MNECHKHLHLISARDFGSTSGNQNKQQNNCSNLKAAVQKKGKKSCLAQKNLRADSVKTLK